MNKKIVIVGANQGGLALSCFAREAGFDVCVYEMKKRENVAYEWHDDMHSKTFTTTGIECPAVINSMTTPGVILMSPQKTHSVTITDEDNSVDVPVSRRELNNMLYERALKAGVIFNYERNAKKLIIERDRITGIVLENGDEVLSDLVVDCCGAESILRENLPDYFGIPQKIDQNDMFFVTRTYFNRPLETQDKVVKRRLYLKHLNEAGISWCFPSHDKKAADVLIGRLGSLSKETEVRALEDLKKENEIIGENPLFGGYLCKIPVRRPISKMFASGYALLGDSAYMTVPMNGSGMSHSLLAAKMLCDTICENEDDPFSASNLYKYQVKYMTQIGADDAPVELIKTWLLHSDDDDIDFLMAKGILSAQILSGMQGTPDISTIISMVKSIISGLTKPLLLIKLLGIVIKMGNQTKITKNIPPIYSENEFLKWQNEYEKAYK